jgi:hypothetical protein
MDKYVLHGQICPSIIGLVSIYDPVLRFLDGRWSYYIALFFFNRYDFRSILNYGETFISSERFIITWHC